MAEQKRVLYVKEGDLDSVKEIAKHLKCGRCGAPPPTAVTVVKMGVKPDDPIALPLIVAGIAPPPEGKDRAMVVSFCASCAAILGIPSE